MTLLRRSARYHKVTIRVAGGCHPRIAIDGFIVVR
jgi:hypothetical protein